MRGKIIGILTLFFLSVSQLQAQQIEREPISTGWADEAVTIGYVSAPSVITLMFVSALINEWNAGYAGIPASIMVFAAPPIIYSGGRSVAIPREISHPRAKLGWTRDVRAIIPTSMALYGFTTDWGATIPLTIASGVLGTASIIAMTSYAFSRAETARKMELSSTTSLQLGLAPLAGGALATVVLRF